MRKRITNLLDELLTEMCNYCTGQEEAERAERASTEKAPEGYKLNPEYIETKSKRVQLVLQPSLYAKVKAAADAEGISFNEYCHRLLEEATREE